MGADGRALLLDGKLGAGSWELEAGSWTVYHVVSVSVDHVQSDCPGTGSNVSAGICLKA